MACIPADRRNTARAAFRSCGRRNRDACAAAAIEAAGSVRPDRQAHLSAPDCGRRRTLRQGRAWPRRRTAVACTPTTFSNSFRSTDRWASNSKFRRCIRYFFRPPCKGFAAEHAEAMQGFAHTHAQLALLRDGFHPESRGGRVELRADGTPVLDYPLNEPIWEAARRALLAMAEIQFAAGATSVQAGARTLRGLYELDPGERGDCPTADETAAAARGVCTRDGRRHDERKARIRFDLARWKPAPRQTMFRSSTDRYSRPASVPIRSSPSMQSPPAMRAF